MTPSYLKGRAPADLEADRAAILAELADIEAAQKLWAALDSLARSTAASSFTRQRAKTAANALGVILDHLVTDDEDEQPFTWNDRP